MSSSKAQQQAAFLASQQKKANDREMKQQEQEALKIKQKQAQQRQAEEGEDVKPRLIAYYHEKLSETICIPCIRAIYLNQAPPNDFIPLMTTEERWHSYVCPVCRFNIYVIDTLTRTLNGNNNG